MANRWQDHRPLLSEEAKAKVPQETQREVQKVLSDIQAEGKDTEENLLKACNIWTIDIGVCFELKYWLRFQLIK